MTAKYFQLSNSDKNRFVSVLKILFGIACIAVGVYWAIYSKTIEYEWLTILFLYGFGFYEIWSGLGKAERYIEIDKTFIRLKKTIFLSAKHIEASEIGKIEIFSLKIDFHLKKGGKIILRFGTTFIETNEKIVDALIKFAEQNELNLEFQPLKC
jgi:hypothetical protein